MKIENIQVQVKVFQPEELNDSDKALVEAAKEATTKSYSPYSQFRVGAAVRLANGTIVSGSNQENVSYPLGQCAERTALFYANSQFPTQAVETLAVAAYSNGDFTLRPITPCGGCRQVILETENRFKTPVRILLYGREGIYEINRAAFLLPLSFDDNALFAK